MQIALILNPSPSGLREEGQGVRAENEGLA